MVDTNAGVVRPSLGASAAVGGGSVGAMLAVVATFHINQGLLAIGWTPLPTEIAQAWQGIIVAATAWFGHWLSHKFR